MQDRLHASLCQAHLTPPVDITIILHTHTAASKQQEHAIGEKRLMHAWPDNFCIIEGSAKGRRVKSGLANSNAHQCKSIAWQMLVAAL